MRGIRALFQICAVVLLALASCPAAHAEGITNSGDDLRTGWYPDESTLTPQLVSGGTFGQLWSTAVEGQVYAQPLLADGTLLVATEHNEVYGLDPASGAVKWSKALGTPWNASDIGCGDLTPTVGVTATPVIDTATGTAYLTHKTYVSGSSGTARWYMDAIDLSSGAERAGFPVELAGSAQNAPAQTFKPTTELQRPGLLLMEGVVYAAFGAHCDIAPYQGWVFGVSTAGLLKARWVSQTSGTGSGIWQSGTGLASDGPGTILLSTGNGEVPQPPTLGSQPPGDLGESVVRLRVQGDGSLKATDFFAPFDAETLSSWDADFGSGGVTGLPDAYFGTQAIPHLAVIVGKDGYVYLLNRDALGGTGEGPAGADQVVQRIGPYGGVWARPGVWPGEGGWLYIPTASSGTTAGGSAGNLRVYQYGVSGTGAPALALQGTSGDAFGFSSSSPVVTSDGTTAGSALVWIVWAPNASGSGAQLRAYDPVPVSGEPVLRWSAQIGTSAKFAPPGVGAGRLYVGTRDGHVLGFGSPVTPALSAPATAFGTTTDGESSQRTVTLTANEALTITKLQSSSSQFELGAPAPALPATLAAGETLQVPVTFRPTGTGPLAATLEASTTSAGAFSFSLSGTGQAAAAKLEASPTVLTFGGTPIGERLASTATFRNVGGTALTIEAVHAPAAPFALEGAPTAGATIQPGGALTVTVTFDPETTGRFEGQLVLQTSAGTGTVVLSGSGGTRGQLRITSETNDFGQVTLGQSASRTFTVQNIGGTTVAITKSKPPSGGDFAATSTLAEGSTIAPGETVEETVAFTPTTLGQQNSDWLINGDDGTGLHTVQFSGVGVAPGAPIETQPPPAAGAGAAPAGHEALAAPLGSPGGSPLLGGGPTALVPSVTLPGGGQLLRAGANGTLSLQLGCPAQALSCRGTLVLRKHILMGAGSARGGARRVRVVTLARGSFALAGGRVGAARLSLSRAGRALLARRRVLRVSLTVDARDALGAHDLTTTALSIQAAAPPR